MAKFTSTLLPQSNDPQEIQKAILDLLDKINQMTGSDLVGVVFQYAASEAPEGYLLCDGASYKQAEYPALFEVIGVNFGSADGAHFNVPDQGTFTSAPETGMNYIIKA